MGYYLTQNKLKFKSFRISVVTPHYILKPEDLKLRPADVESRLRLLKTTHMQETGLE